MFGCGAEGGMFWKFWAGGCPNTPPPPFLLGWDVFWVYEC